MIRSDYHILRKQKTITKKYNLDMVIRFKL